MSAQTIAVVSIGQMACRIQQMPDVIREAALQLGIAPSMRLNGVDHFDESDLERIAEHLQAKRN